MPEPTSRASGKMLNADTGPPVSGNTEAEAVAVAVALLLALAEDDAEELAELLAEELVGWSTHTVTDSPLAAGFVVQPDALALEDCAKAPDANSSVPSMDRLINSSSFLTGSSLVGFPYESHVRHDASSGSRTGEVRRTPIPRTRVNRAKGRAEAATNPGPRSRQAALHDATPWKRHDRWK